MSPRIAILVNYRSAHGGLHDHVEDQITFARNLGFTITLACPPGSFANRMSDRADVVTTNFADPDATARLILNVGAPDLIHAHPGLARTAAYALKAHQRVPLLVTDHGSRPETLTAAEPEVDIAITVSELTRRFILKRTDADPARVVTIPNAVDTHVFRRQPPPTTDTKIVLFASRWDADKQYVVDLTIEAMNHVQSHSGLSGIDILLAGDGEHLTEIESVGAHINAVRGRDSFRSLGWLDYHGLADAMARASVVVSPGRGALQSLAIGRATVALGSKGYVGFLSGDTLLQGMDANFGSGGIGPRKYPAGLIGHDIERALRHAHDPRLLQAYQAVAAERTLQAVENAHARIWNIARALAPGSR